MDTSNEVSQRNISDGGPNDDFAFNDSDMVFNDNNSAQAPPDISDVKSLPENEIEFGNSPAPPVRGVSPSASENSLEKPANKKRSRSSPLKKKRKKRRVVFDDDDMALSTDHIKDMLNDTSSIAPTCIHPAQEPVDGTKSTVLGALSVEELLRRPTIADDSFLAKELLDLWSRHTALAAGKELPYKLTTSQENDGEEEPEAPRDGDDDGMKLNDYDEPMLAPEEDQPSMNDNGIPFDDEPLPNMDTDDLPMDGRDSEFVMICFLSLSLTHSHNFFAQVRCIPMPVCFRWLRPMILMMCKRMNL